MIIPKDFLGPVSRPIERGLRIPLIFTLLVLYQGLFSGNAITIPKNVQKLFDSQTFRFVSLMMIALTASQDIEVALVSVLVFLGILYAFKTKEERKKTGFI